MLIVLIRVRSVRSASHTRHIDIYIYIHGHGSANQESHFVPHSLQTRRPGIEQVITSRQHVIHRELQRACAETAILRGTRTRWRAREELHSDIDILGPLDLFDSFDHIFDPFDHLVDPLHFSNRSSWHGGSKRYLHACVHARSSSSQNQAGSRTSRSSFAGSRCGRSRCGQSEGYQQQQDRHDGHHQRTTGKGLPRTSMAHRKRY